MAALTWPVRQQLEVLEVQLGEQLRRPPGYTRTHLYARACIACFAEPCFLFLLLSGLGYLSARGLSDGVVQLTLAHGSQFHLTR